jgi:hypothetical protein
MIRKSNSPYQVETIFTSIKNVARETKHLDPQFLDGTSNISNAFVEYAKPLVGPLPKTASVDEFEE